jgi:biopolymer transport protein ExbD
MTKPPPITPLTLNLAPMVDVMMCLLIFFMLATKMVEREHTLIDLPTATAAREPERTEAGRFVVNIRREGGRPVYMLRDETQPLDALLAQLSSAARLDPRMTCLIRADKAAAYADVEAVLAGCSRVGVRSVQFGALQGGASR